MRSTLSRIPKMHGPVVPEAGWEMAGTTPRGQQLYTEKIPRSRAVPDFERVECKQCFGERQEEVCEECDGTGQVDGEQRWKVNPLNGERLYKLNKPEFFTQHRMFFVHSDGQFNQYKVDWAPPTHEEIEAAKHTKQVADMIPALASALVDKGLDVDEIVARLTTPVAEVKDEAPEPTAPEEAVPFDDSQATDEKPVAADANEEL